MKLKKPTEAAKAQPRDKKHSRISPSMLSALKACPGYESDFKESAASERGEKMHAVQETEEMDFTLEAKDQLIAATTLEETLKFDERSEYAPFIELEMDYTPLKIKDFEKGTLDRAIALEINENDEPTKMAALDFKFGQWEVDPVPANIQFRTYALGLFLEYPTLEEVEYTLIQPAHNLSETHTFVRERDFAMIVTQIGAIAKRRHKWQETQDNALLKSHPDYCTFCMRQASCRVWQDYAVKMANESNCLGAPVLNIEKLDSPETADEEELLRVMRWIGPMEAYLKKLKQFATAAYDAGALTGSGIKLVEKDGKATIIDPIRTGEILQEEYEVSPGEYAAACTIGITAIRTLVSEATSKDKGKASAAAIQRLEDDGLIERGTQIRYMQLARAAKRK